MTTDSPTRIDQARATLAEGLTRLQTSEAWRATLANVAEFQKGAIGRYSFRNQVMIMNQSPSALDVQGFRAWLERGRVVRKGEHALWIFAPCPVKAKPAEESEEAKGPRMFFKAIPVFEASQTERIEGPNGRDLPERPTIAPLVQGDSRAAELQILCDVACSQIPNVSRIERRERRPGDLINANGWFNVANGSIVVLSDRPVDSQFRTLVHELAHAILHTDNHDCRGEQELEAESVAFVVSHALGLDTACYSFPYVATWSKGTDAAAKVAASGERIVKATRLILDAVRPTATTLNALSEAA
jgi:hypothetical protein